MMKTKKIRPEELDTEDIQNIYTAAQDTIHTAAKENNTEPTEEINQAIAEALHSPLANNNEENTEQPSPLHPAAEDEDEDVEHIHLQQVLDGLRFNILCGLYTNPNGVMKLELLMPDGTNPNNCSTQ